MTEYELSLKNFQRMIDKLDTIEASLNRARRRMRFLTIALGIALAVLILNGLRVVLGVPPVSYWRHGRRCPVCEGVGYLRAHSHTGEIVDIGIPVPVSDAEPQP